MMDSYIEINNIKSIKMKTLSSGFIKTHRSLCLDLKFNTNTLGMCNDTYRNKASETND